METPVLSTEQKLAIREAQLKLVGLQIAFKDLQQKVQAANNELMKLIADAAGDLDADYSFSLETLTFVPKPKPELVPTPEKQ